MRRSDRFDADPRARRGDGPYPMDDAPESELDADLRRLERLTRWLDDAFVLPGTGFRFGLDPIFGLLPGIGDTATAAMTGYTILIARKYKAPFGLQVKLVGNLALDWLIGAIPLVGDLFDFGFKANRRNLDLLRGWLEGRRARDGGSRGGGSRGGAGVG